MLTIFTPDNAPRDVFLDASELFDMTRLDGCNVDRAIISGIDRGQYRSSSEFIDRFGDQRSIDDLSMGSKIALAIYHNPDKVCSALEAGINALSMIIRYCKDGSMIIHDLAYPFDTRGEDLIDVCYKGYRFTSFERFATYMKEEWPDAPDLDEGVELCI